MVEVSPGVIWIGWLSDILPKETPSSSDCTSADSLSIETPFVKGLVKLKETVTAPV